MKLKLNKVRLAIVAFATCVMLMPVTAFALDHDGDGKSDISVFRPSIPSAAVEGAWYINSTALEGTLVYQWGLSGDMPLQGNFSQAAGMGVGNDLAVFRPSTGTWFIRNFTSDLRFSSSLGAFQWGLPGDKPVPCDFDGDDRDEMAVYRESDGNWYLRNSQGAIAYDSASIQQWGGLPTDVPVPADYDNDGKCDFTVFRDGEWFIITSSESTKSITIPWGTVGDVPVPGNFDSDSITDLAIYRPINSLWIIRRSTLAGLTFNIFQWGLEGDIPVASDFTGDGKTDIAVYRPSTGTWYIRTSESDYASATASQFGLPGDIPLGDVAGN